MKLYIPEIGDQLVLSEDWDFILFAENRNRTLAKALGYRFEFNKGFIDLKHNIEPPKSSNYKKDQKGYADAYIKYHEDTEKLVVNNIHVTIPAGCRLIVDRIYIRKGISAYSSISFYVKGFLESLDLSYVEEISDITGKKRKNVRPRFWAKLEDCNHIEFAEHLSSFRLND